MTLVHVSEVSKQYGRMTAVDRITMSIGRGEIVGLVGPNGAGKTTVLRMIAGLLRPTGGHVQLAAGVTSAATRYFGGERTLPPNVTAKRWLALWHVATASPAPSRRMGVLSRGTRQRIGLQAMVTPVDTQVLLLDEPWESLDPDASRWLSDILLQRRAAGAGILVSSHRIHDLADVCDRCMFLVDGRLAPETVAFPSDLVRLDRSAELFDAFDRARGRT